MASDVQISILGPLEVRVGFGDPVDVVGPRLRRLLVRLALEPDAVDVVRFRSLALAGRDELRIDPSEGLQAVHLDVLRGEVAPPRRPGAGAREGGPGRQARDDLDSAERLACEVGAEDEKIFVAHARADVARWQGRLEEARELLAGLALRGGDAERAATLLGTAETLRGMPDQADVGVVRTRAATRAALGAEGFAQAHQRGVARSREAVLAAPGRGGGGSLR